MKKVVDYYRFEEIYRLRQYMDEKEVEKMCIEKFIPSKKKRILGLGNAPYLESSSSSSCFSRQISNMKVSVEDFSRVTKENEELKQKFEMFMEKFEAGHYVERDPFNRPSTSQGSRISARGSFPRKSQIEFQILIILPLQDVKEMNFE